MKRKKLSRILNKTWFYVLLVTFTFIYFLININIPRKSKYSLDDTVFEGTLKSIVIKNNKVTFMIKGEEELIVNYYPKENEDTSYYRNTYPLGSKVRITGTLKEPINNTISNTFNYKEYLNNHRMHYTCTMSKIEILSKNINLFYKVKNSIINRIMKSEIRDYMYTLIIGDKSLMDEETMGNYRKNGVTHLFAISGMHIGLFSMAVMKLLEFLKIKKNSRYIFAIVFIWFYAFLTGFSSSVMRACTLFTLISLFKLLKIEVSTLKVLILSGCILILLDYTIALDIGFIYSFTTTFGLLYSAKVISKHKVLGTSLVATLYSLPITIQNFYRMNLLSVLSNVVFVPIVSIVIYPLCLLTFFFNFLEPITKMALFFLELLNDVLSGISILTFVVPKMNIITVVIYYAILLFKGRKKLFKVSLILISLVLLNKLKPIIDSNYYVEFLDVGQGDSALIRSPNSKEVVLIDTGGVESFTDGSTYHVASNTLTYLNSLGLDRIDLLILTHGDADHLGDAMYLIENTNVKNVIINEGEINFKEKEILNSGVNILKDYKGSLDLRLLNRKIWNDENDASIVTSLKIYDTRFLFMGDASKKTEKYLMENEEMGHTDIIKLGHHGSKTSSGETFLEKVNPSIGIISSGRGNRFNHPSPETLDTLNKLGIPYLNTQDSGTISYKINKKSVTYDVCTP